MRTKVDWRSGGRVNYENFCKAHPDISISSTDWSAIVYSYNEWLRDYILETGERVKFPAGIGEFSISKRKPSATKEVKGKTVINLPIDWKKSSSKGKWVFTFNYHTEGYRFKWLWFKRSAIFELSDYRSFIPHRTSSRMLAHYLNTDEKYQHLYKEWETVERRPRKNLNNCKER